MDKFIDDLEKIIVKNCYIEDNDKNLNNLYKYARELNVLGLVDTYIGVWF